jgi:hypothetical protein
MGTWAILTIGLFTWVEPEHMDALLRFLRAGDAGAARAELSAWSPATRAAAAAIVRFDFLYDLVHNNAVALWCIWAAQRLAAPGVITLARAVAWTMWLDTGLNLIENAAALHMIGGGGTTPWFGLVVATTIFRFATLWFGFAVGAVGLAAARWRRRNDRRRGSERAGFIEGGSRSC